MLSSIVTAALRQPSPLTVPIAAGMASHEGAQVRMLLLGTHSFLQEVSILELFKGSVNELDDMLTPTTVSSNLSRHYHELASPGLSSSTGEPSPAKASSPGSSSVGGPLSPFSAATPGDCASASKRFEDGSTSKYSAGVRCPRPCRHPPPAPAPDPHTQGSPSPSLRLWPIVDVGGVPSPARTLMCSLLP